ncbi:MAG: hypothetical protein RLP44_02510 [Aggregatilineales bacterium]
MIHKHKITVAVAGSDGSATGSNQSREPINGRLIAAHLDYVTQPATCDVTITATLPTRSLLAVANSATDAVYYPRAQVQDLAGAGVTYDETSEVYDTVPLNDYVNVAVAGGNAGSVIVTLYVEG